MTRSDLVDLTLTIHASTDAAILVSDDGVEKTATWLPKSQVEIERFGPERPGEYEAIVTIPVWLATERRLI
jgi:hypothetical protein